MVDTAEVKALLEVEHLKLQWQGVHCWHESLSYMLEIEQKGNRNQNLVGFVLNNQSVEVEETDSVEM